MWKSRRNRSCNITSEIITSHYVLHLTLRRCNTQFRPLAVSSKAFYHRYVRKIHFCQYSASTYALGRGQPVKLSPGVTGDCVVHFASNGQLKRSGQSIVHSMHQEKVLSYTHTCYTHLYSGLWYNIDAYFFNDSDRLMLYTYLVSSSTRSQAVASRLTAD